jgi:hypothetical protein
MSQKRMINSPKSLQAISIIEIEFKLILRIEPDETAHRQLGFELNFDLRKKFWEGQIAYIPSILHGPHRRRRIQHFCLLVYVYMLPR